MENNTQLLKGVLEFCVLKFISREPTYGYEIVMHLKYVLHNRQKEVSSGKQHTIAQGRFGILCSEIH